MTDATSIPESPKLETPEKITVREFLETVPPGQERSVSDLSSRETSHRGGVTHPLGLTAIKLHCDSEVCNGERFFEPQNRPDLNPGTTVQSFVAFKCKNCGQRRKTYALWSTLSGDERAGKLYKLGEFPQFGPPTPSKVISMLGAEKSYYLKGRRAENQAMGIAAFAYYRRVVENQKQKIFEEILRVSSKIGASKEMLADLESGKAERQFSKAVEAVKHGLPGALLINGHNPLTLLHNALSEGMHAQSDEECLELARSIRFVLTEMVERLGNALKEEAELTQAVARLLKVKATKADA